MVSLKTVLIFSKNFLDFWSDATEKQRIINLGTYGSKKYVSVVLSDSEVAFLMKGEDKSLWFISLVRFAFKQRCIINEVWRQKYFTSILQVFYRGLQLFWFWFFSVLRQFFLCKLSKFNVELPSDNFSIDLSVISGGFLSRRLKSSFHFWSLCSWLAAFSLVIEVFFLPLTSFTYLLPAMFVYYLLIVWFYWFGLECFQFVLFCVFNYSIWAFLSFYLFVFLKVFFFLFRKDFISFFSSGYCLPGKSTFCTWFGFYPLGFCLYLGCSEYSTSVTRNMSFRCLLTIIKCVPYS